MGRGKVEELCESPSFTKLLNGGHDSTHLHLPTTMTTMAIIIMAIIMAMAMNRSVMVGEEHGEKLVDVLEPGG